jgi:hypothetical protein
MAKRSEVTDRGATEGSSSNRLAVSLMLAAKLRRQQSGASSVIANPNMCEETVGVPILYRHQ